MRFGFIIAVAVALSTGCTPPKTYKTIDGAMLGTTFHIVAQQMHRFIFFSYLCRLEYF